MISAGNRTLDLVLLIVGMCIAVIVLFYAGHSRAHMHDRPDLDQWLTSLSSKDRGPCCDSTEAETMADPDWRNASEMKKGECVPGNPGITSDKPPVYCVRLEHPDRAGEYEWYQVPPGAVVEQPNRAGPALIWLYWVRSDPDVSPYIRCFLPGTLS
jgi:hypothetical protein